MRIAILAFEGSVLSAISGMADLFWIANHAVATTPQFAEKFQQPPFQTFIVSSDGGPVWDVHERLIHIDDSFSSAGQPDVVIAPGMILGTQRQPVNMHSVGKAARWIKNLHKNGSLIAATGTGTLVLGEAGLLNGKAYSTTWWFYHTMIERYPRARSVWGKVIEEDGGILTTGGCFSWISLALHIITKGAGAEIAKLTADMALIDNDLLSQQLFMPPDLAYSAHPMLVKAQAIIRFQRPSITASQLASALNTTERTLQRKLRIMTKETPKEFITRIRIESACAMLSNPVMSIQHVAIACGYSEDTSFRKAFSHVMGMSPGEYRKWVTKTPN